METTRHLPVTTAEGLRKAQSDFGQLLDRWVASAQEKQGSHMECPKEIYDEAYRDAPPVIPHHNAVLMAK